MYTHTHTSHVSVTPCIIHTIYIYTFFIFLNIYCTIFIYFLYFNKLNRFFRLNKHRKNIVLFDMNGDGITKTRSLSCRWQANRTRLQNLVKLRWTLRGLRHASRFHRFFCSLLLFLCVTHFCFQAAT